MTGRRTGGAAPNVESVLRDLLRDADRPEDFNPNRLSVREYLGEILRWDASSTMWTFPYDEVEDPDTDELAALALHDAISDMQEGPC
jgi:hypothetical protein